MEFVQTAVTLNLDIKVLLVYTVKEKPGENLKGIYLILRCNGISMARWGTTLEEVKYKKVLFFYLKNSFLWMFFQKSSLSNRELKKYYYYMYILKIIPNKLLHFFSYPIFSHTVVIFTPGLFSW